MVTLVILGMLSSIFFILALCTSFLTTSFFTTSLYSIKLTGTGNNLSVKNLSVFLFKLFKLVGRFFSLSIYNMSTLDFKLAKSTFLAVGDLSIPDKFFKSIFDVELDKSNSTFTFPKDFGLENIHSFILCLFYLSNYFHNLSI